MNNMDRISSSVETQNPTPLEEDLRFGSSDDDAAHRRASSPQHRSPGGPSTRRVAAADSPRPPRHSDQHLASGSSSKKAPTTNNGADEFEDSPSASVVGGGALPHDPQLPGFAEAVRATSILSSEVLSDSNYHLREAEEAANENFPRRPPAITIDDSVKDDEGQPSPRESVLKEWTFNRIEQLLPPRQEGCNTITITDLVQALEAGGVPAVVVEIIREIAVVDSDDADGEAKVLTGDLFALLSGQVRASDEEANASWDAETAFDPLKGVVDEPLIRNSWQRFAFDWFHLASIVFVCVAPIYYNLGLVRAEPLWVYVLCCIAHVLWWIDMFLTRRRQRALSAADVVASLPVDLIVYWFAIEDNFSARPLRTLSHDSAIAVLFFTRLVKLAKLARVTTLFEFSNMDIITPMFVNFFFLAKPILQVISFTVVAVNLVTLCFMHAQVSDIDRVPRSDYLTCLAMVVSVLCASGSAADYVDTAESHATITTMTVASFLVRGALLALIVASMERSSRVPMITELVTLLDTFDVAPDVRSDVLSLQLHRELVGQEREMAPLHKLPDEMQRNVLQYMRISVVRNVACFAGLSKRLVHAVAASLKRRIVPPSTVIAEHGAPLTEMSVIARGYAALLNSFGYMVHILTRGDSFGEAALVAAEHKRQLSVSIVAVTHCELLVLSHDVFKKLSAKHPMLLTLVVDNLSLVTDGALELDSRVQHSLAQSRVASIVVPPMDGTGTGPLSPPASPGILQGIQSSAFFRAADDLEASSSSSEGGQGSTGSVDNHLVFHRGGRRGGGDTQLSSSDTFGESSRAWSLSSRLHSTSVLPTVDFSAFGSCNNNLKLAAPETTTLMSKRGSVCVSGDVPLASSRNPTLTSSFPRRQRHQRVAAATSTSPSNSMERRRQAQAQQRDEADAVMTMPHLGSMSSSEEGDQRRLGLMMHSSSFSPQQFAALAQGGVGGGADTIAALREELAEKDAMIGKLLQRSKEMNGRFRNELQRINTALIETTLMVNRGR